MSEIGDRIKDQAPLSFFPDEIISVNKLSAPTAAQLALIMQYNAAASRNDWATCQQILSDNPGLKNCRITSTDYNTIIDEIRAIELYYNQEMEQHFADLQSETFRQARIDDSQASDGSTFSSNKINSLLDRIEHISHVPVPLVGWTDAQGRTIRKLQEDESNPFVAPYTQSISIQGMRNNSYPLWYYDGEPTAEQYETFCYVSSLETRTDQIKLTCSSDIPQADIRIMIKGL